MSLRKFLIPLLSVAFASPLAANLRDVPVPENAAGRSIGNVGERTPSEARQMNAGAARTPEARNNNNANLWGGNAQTNAQEGSSGVIQPQNRGDLPRANLVDPGGEPVKDQKGEPKTQAIVPKGFFLQATPFVVKEPAVPGHTRHQVTGRVSDLSPQAQKAVRTEMVKQRDAIKAQKGDTSKLDSVIGAIDAGQGSDVFIDKGVMDVSDSAGGGVIVADLGDFGRVSQQVIPDVIVVAPRRGNFADPGSGKTEAMIPSAPGGPGSGKTAAMIPSAPSAPSAPSQPSGPRTPPAPMDGARIHANQPSGPRTPPAENAGLRETVEIRLVPDMPPVQAPATRSQPSAPGQPVRVPREGTMDVRPMPGAGSRAIAVVLPPDSGMPAIPPSQLGNHMAGMPQSFAVGHVKVGGRPLLNTGTPLVIPRENGGSTVVIPTELREKFEDNFPIPLAVPGGILTIQKAADERAAFRFDPTR